MPQDLSATVLRLQGPADAKVGETFTLQLTMQSGQPVVSLPVALGFDNRALQVVGVTEGDFLKQGGALTNFSSRVDPSGQVLISGTRSGEGGATMSGTVASVSFRTLANTGSAQIKLLAATPVGLGGVPVAVPVAAPYSVAIRP
jgi:general secretion pathway protein D